MKKIRLLLLALTVLLLFALAGCTGGSYYGVNTYHMSAWDYNHYDRYDNYYDDRRDRYIDRRNDLARRNYINQRRAGHPNYTHQRTNPNRGSRRAGRRR